MSEQTAAVKNENEKKKKLIAIPTDWEDKIREFHRGTVSGYILIALQERMQRDGLI